MPTPNRLEGEASKCNMDYGITVGIKPTRERQQPSLSQNTIVPICECKRGNCIATALSRALFFLLFPRGLLLLLSIISNKNDQGVKPSDLDGLTPNLLDLSSRSRSLVTNHRENGPQAEVCSCPGKDRHSQTPSLTGRSRTTVQVVILSENAHFEIFLALQTSFAGSVGVWKGGICITAHPGTRSIRFGTWFCSVKAKVSNDIQHNRKIKCHK